MTYNEQVQIIAEKMVTNEVGMSDTEKRLHNARIAVAEKAEGIISFFNTFVLPALPKGDLSFSPDSLADYLKEQGLIPDDGQEGERDGKE